jgi:release factor glutamine methyltransferase
VTDTLGSILTKAAATLSTAGCDQPRRRARWLIATSLDLSPTELLVYPERELDHSEAEWLDSLVHRMASGEPLSRVLGRREFWGLNFTLSSETLDPRADSETIIEAVLARVADRGASIRVLDLGTGSGCLLLALLSEFHAATGIGVDLSEGAVTTARHNAGALGLADRTGFLVGDWGTALAGRFEVILTNPPYIASSELAELPSEVNRYDPRRALDGGDDGLAAYRSIAENLLELLAPFGLILVEVGSGQATAVAAILAARGLSIEAIECDLVGTERCVIARRTAGAQSAIYRGKKSWNAASSRLG